ncbi:MAG: hypothetical protein HPY83_19170 [Anaerolineae bacterium]|nr:hypothetical protein [Anaerolineae bacterium]
MRRSRIPLVPLAIGFLLGSLVTAHAQEFIFIPFVAQAGTGSAEVRIINLRPSAAADTVSFFGEVWNDTSSAIWLHQVTVELLDGTGSPVDQVSTIGDLAQVIPPGEKRPFLAYTDQPVEDWVSYRASADWEPTGYLTVLSQELRQTANGWAIDVAVQNQYPVSVRNPLVIGTLYGPRGATIGYNWAVPGPDSPELVAPGARFTTTVSFDRDDTYAYDSSVTPSGYGSIVVP